MVKALLALAKYLTWWFIKPLVSRCYVANLTRMQTSSSNQTHVLVASNNISLSCLEGRIYIITLLNPLPANAHYFIKSITSSRCVEDTLGYTLVHTLVHDKHSAPACWVSRKLRPKSKTIACYTTACFNRLVYSSSIQCPTPKWMCLVLQRDSRFVSRKLSRNRHCTDWTAWLKWLLYHLQW